MGLWHPDVKMSTISAIYSLNIRANDSRSTEKKKLRSFTPGLVPQTKSSWRALKPDESLSRANLHKSTSKMNAGKSAGPWGDVLAQTDGPVSASKRVADQFPHAGPGFHPGVSKQ